MTAPRAPANRAEVVEVMATAIQSAFRPEPIDENTAVYFAECVRFSERAAPTILAALEATGVCLVPAVATEAEYAVTGMRREATDSIRKLMLKASPYAPEGGQ